MNNDNLFRYPVSPGDTITLPKGLEVHVTAFRNLEIELDEFSAGDFEVYQVAKSRDMNFEIPRIHCHHVKSKAWDVWFYWTSLVAPHISVKKKEEPKTYTVEPHGKGFVIYSGRDNQHHGLNHGQLVNCEDWLPDFVEKALNHYSVMQVIKK